MQWNTRWNALKPIAASGGHHRKRILGCRSTRRLVGKQGGGVDDLNAPNKTPVFGHAQSKRVRSLANTPLETDSAF